MHIVHSAVCKAAEIHFRGFVFTKMTPTETENNILLWLVLFDVMVDLVSSHTGAALHDCLLPLEVIV